jgi:hypothetical protein
VGTTFVGIGEPRRGFWISDGVLEIWLRFLALHVEDPVESGSLQTRIRDQWLLASRGFFGGCVPDGLEEAVSSPEGDKIVRTAIDSLLESLRSAPPELSRSVLNLMGFSGYPFIFDVETWRLIEVGEAFLALLDGKITAGPSDSAFMPGCREQSHAEIEKAANGAT